MNAEESDPDRGTDTAGENGLPGHHEAPDRLSFEPSSLHHAPMIDHSTPRDNSPDHFGGNTEIDIFDKVLVSYLLRHFKQGPGQWCVMDGHGTHI